MSSLERYRLTGLVRKDRIRSSEALLSEAGFEDIEILGCPFPSYSYLRRIQAQISVSNEGELKKALSIVDDRLVSPSQDILNPRFMRFETEQVAVD